MKKKLLAIALVAMLGLTACSDAEGSKKKDKKDKTEAATEAETTTEEETTEAEITTEEKTTEAKTTTEEKTTEAEKAEKKDEKKSESKSVEGLGSKYADLDNRSFAYEGKVFTVGKNTYQDLIDAGIPFKEDDLNNIDNNVNSNHSTSWYAVKVSDYSTIQFQFSNYTDSNIKEKDCVLSYARWFTIYTPLSTFDEGRRNDIAEDIERAGEVVSFAFPLTLTKKELLENSPEPTEETKYNEVKYKVDSTKYYGSSGYEFKFEDDNNQLRDVYITWLP